MIALDFNTLTPNLAYHFGFYLFDRSLLDLILGSASLEQVALTHFTGVKIIPSIPLTIQPRSLESGLDQIYSSGFDWVVIDTAPSQLELLEPVLAQADLALVITEPELPSVAGCRRICRWIQQRNLEPGIIINKSRKESQELSLDEVEASCDASVLGVIPERAEVRRGVASGNPVVINNPYSPASIQFRKLAGSLCRVGYIPPKLRWPRYLIARFREKRAPDLNLIPQLKQQEPKLSAKELEFFLVSLEQQAAAGMIPRELVERIKARLAKQIQI